MKNEDHVLSANAGKPTVNDVRKTLKWCAEILMGGNYSATLNQALLFLNAVKDSDADKPIATYDLVDS